MGALRKAFLVRGWGVDPKKGCGRLPLPLPAGKALVMGTESVLHCGLCRAVCAEGREGDLVPNPRK